MKTNTIQGHQGDVQFKAVSLPRGAKKIENTPLAYGETSGHCHALTGDVEMYEHKGIHYAVVGTDGAFLQHVHETMYKANLKTNSALPVADHQPIRLEAGTYAFGIHKRYNPFSRVWERVID